ncbi:MAG: hypothetical protein CL605_04470 [Altibacter sp.]|nr:hypothetical protein [Altibacter sp.]
MWASKVLKTFKNILCFPFGKVKNDCIFAPAYAKHCNVNASAGKFRTILRVYIKYKKRFFQKIKH